GLVLFILAGGLTIKKPEDESSSSIPYLRIGWLITAVLLVAFTAWRAIQPPQAGMLFEQLLTWGAAMVALVLMVRQRRTERAGNGLRRWEYGLLILLFVAALGVRVNHLDSNPPFLDQDEGTFAVEGSNARLSNYALSPFSVFFDFYPRLYPALIGISS